MKIIRNMLIFSRILVLTLIAIFLSSNLLSNEKDRANSNQRIIYFINSEGKELVSFDNGYNWIEEKQNIKKYSEKIIFTRSDNVKLISYNGGFDWQIYNNPQFLNKDTCESLLDDFSFKCFYIYDIYGNMIYKDPNFESLYYECIIDFCKSTLSAGNYFIYLINHKSHFTIPLTIFK